MSVIGIQRALRALISVLRAPCRTLASISVVTCTIVAVLIWSCIGYDRDTVQREPFAGIRLSFPDWRNILQTYGMIAFQFDIHPMLMTIEVDMRDKRRIGEAVTYGIFSE